MRQRKHLKNFLMILKVTEEDENYSNYIVSENAARLTDLEENEDYSVENVTRSKVQQYFDNMQPSIRMWSTIVLVMAFAMQNLLNGKRVKFLHLPSMMTPPPPPTASSPPCKCREKSRLQSPGCG